jgi:preprotein translocase subunit SecA
VLLRTIDSLWVEHLTELDDMRRGIGLRGYAQQDPLNEFRKEAFSLYTELQALIRHQVAATIFRVQVTREAPPPAFPMPMVAPISAGAAVANASATAGGGRDGGAAAAATAARVGSGTVTGSGSLAGTAAAGVASGITGARGLPAAPTVRAVRESLGDQTVSAGGQQARPGYTPAGAHIGRNDPCWCGSGVKYKKCHGR